jgi:hypothetical protein
LKGDHVFALPYASCLSTFRAPGWGHPQSFCLVVGGTQLYGSWYLLAIVRLQGFSSRGPAAPPRRWSPKTMTTSPWVGRSKSGCDLGPDLSFKDVHHPRWGGGRAEPELYLPRGFVGQPLLQHSRERALTGPASGADFDNAGLVDSGRRQLQRVGLAGFLYLSSPLERRRGRGQGGSSIRREAIAATVRPPGAGVVVAVAGTGDGEPPVGLLLLHRPPNRVGLFVPAKVEPGFRL